MQSSNPLLEPLYKRDPRAYARQRHYARVWPKCEACGFIARCLSDIGCLNCHAMRQPPRAWTAEEDDHLEMYAGKEGPTHLQFSLYSKTGYARSRDSLRKKLQDMGIKVTTHQEGYTIAQLMAMTGRPYTTFQNLINKGQVKNIASGRRILISTDDGQRLIELYRKKEEPSYSLEEAAALIGCGTTAISVAATKRGLPSWKEGHTRRVCKATVDRAVDYLRETGKIRIPWRSLAKR